MKKRISSLLLVFCLCMSLLTVTAGAAGVPTVSGSYANGVVTVTGSGFPVNTQYSMISVKDGSNNLIALGSGTATNAGALNLAITTGSISTPSNCKVYVYNDIGGAVVASGSVTATSGGRDHSAGGSSSEGSQSTETTVTGKTDSSGKTTASVTTNAVNTLVEAAQKAEANGESSIVEIKLSITAATKSVALTIPSAAFSNIADKTEASVQINAGIAAITLDADAVDTICSSAGSKDVSVSVAAVDNSSLNTAAQQLVGTRPVYDFTITAGHNTVSDFGGGSAAVSIPYTLQLDEDVNAIVVYYIGSNGALQAVRGAYNSATKSVNFVASHFSKYAVGYNKVSFTDVGAGEWYSEPVTFCAARGITTGTTATTFSPAEKVTRAQFIVMLMRAYGMEPANNSGNNFADAGNTYYTGYLAKAKELGITAGTGSNLFAPDNQITRQEMFTMLYRTLNTIGELPEAESDKTLSSFSDSASVADYAEEAMTVLIKGGVIAGSNGKLDPQGPSSRAQMVQVLYTLLSK